MASFDDRELEEPSSEILTPDFLARLQADFAPFGEWAHPLAALLPVAAAIWTDDEDLSERMLTGDPEAEELPEGDLENFEGLRDLFFDALSNLMARWIEQDSIEAIQALAWDWASAAQKALGMEEQEFRTALAQGWIFANDALDDEFGFGLREHFDVDDEEDGEPAKLVESDEDEDEEFEEEWNSIAAAMVDVLGGEAAMAYETLLQHIFNMLDEEHPADLRRAAGIGVLAQSMVFAAAMLRREGGAEGAAAADEED